MDEKQLRRLIGRVKDGKLSRRAFVGRMLALGITAPLASEMLAFCGAARAQEKEKVPYKPTKRGGGGALKVLWWQGATLLNPHFAVGTKDQDGSRIFYEPLAGVGFGRRALSRCSRPRSRRARTAASRPTACR